MDVLSAFKPSVTIIHSTQIGEVCIMPSDYDKAVSWAAGVLQHDPLILDTETTGLDDDAELCAIAIIDVNGNTLLDTLVKPTKPIPLGASEVHGIQTHHVANAPGWLEIRQSVYDLICNRQIIIYNATYDLQILRNSDRCNGEIVSIDYWDKAGKVSCAMLRYAAYWGVLNYHGQYKWQKLTNACIQQGIPDPDAPAHSALGDCLRTLALVRAMAASAVEVQS